MTRYFTPPWRRRLKLTATTAEKVFGWRNVHKPGPRPSWQETGQTRARWRLAKVPDYSSDPGQAYAIDERMKQPGRWDAYIKELARLTKSKSLPLGWATPEQRNRAALKGRSQ